PPPCSATSWKGGPRSSSSRPARSSAWAATRACPCPSTTSCTRACSRASSGRGGSERGMARLADGLVRGDDGVVRCSWGASTPEYRRYHDREWGRPMTRDRRLFEKICLEGLQSG